MKENIIKNDFPPDRRGGSRDEFIKVSEDTIKCIITPIVDFPIFFYIKYRIVSEF